MVTKTLEKKVETLSREVASLRSLIFRVVREKQKDPEGEYRPEFVRRILKAATEPAPHTFSTGKEFLKLLRAKSK